MDRTWGFTNTLELGKSGGNSVVPTSLFFRPDGYLYGVLRNSVGADELKYRIEKFLASSTARGTSPGRLRRIVPLH